MTQRVPETRDELEGRVPDTEREATPHLPLWQALVLLTAGLFLLLSAREPTVWSVLRGAGLAMLGLSSLLARWGRLPRPWRARAAWIGVAGVLAYFVGLVAWFVRNFF